jgi:hypothetical protein
MGTIRLIHTASEHPKNDALARRIRTLSPPPSIMAIEFLVNFVYFEFKHTDKLAKLSG